MQPDVSIARMLLTVAVTALVAGLLIGLTGIGGVLLVPVLTQAGGVPLDRAIAASLLGFLVAGIYAAFVQLRRERLPLSSMAVLCACAAVGAVVGATTLDALPATGVRIFIAVLCLASGTHALFRARRVRNPQSSTLLLGALGVVVGCMSAWSGTGGPVTLIPLLLAFGASAGVAVSLGLAAQVPITLAATSLYALQGRLDLPLAATLSVLLLVGTVAGAALSPKLSSRALEIAVAAILIAVGIWFAWGTLLQTPSG